MNLQHPLALSRGIYPSAGTLFFLSEAPGWQISGAAKPDPPY